MRWALRVLVVLVPVAVIGYLGVSWRYTEGVARASASLMASPFMR